MVQAASVSDPELKTRVRSFTDLRRFAADDLAGIRASSAASGDAFLTGRRRLFQSGGPLEVGAIDLPAGRGRVEAMSADEFVIVCGGGVILEHDGGSIRMREGSSVVLPRGSGFSWHSESKSTLIYMRQDSDPTEASAPLLIDESAPLEPSGAPLAELLIGPTPACSNHTDYRSAAGKFTCGTWSSTPYRRKAMLYPHCELMYLLEGSVTLEDEAGQSHTFTRNDVFVVEQGARCSWQSLEYVKKVYAIFRPAS